MHAKKSEDESEEVKMTQAKRPGKSRGLESGCQKSDEFAAHGPSSQILTSSF